MDRSRGRYEFLDGLRGVAAGGIVWLHVTSVCGVFSIPPNAFLAVDFFFCLSGFIVAHTYGRAVHDLPSALDVLRRRSVRLMPMAVLASVIGGAVAIVRVSLTGDLRAPDVLTAVLLNALLIPSSSFLPAYPEAYSLNPPLWSLALEMLASVAFVCGLGRVSTRSLAILAVLAAAIVVRIGLGLDTLDFGSVPSTISYGPVRIAGPFLLGMLVQRGTVEPNRLGWLTLPALIGLLFWPAKDVALQIVAVTLLFPAMVMIAAETSVPKSLIRVCRWSGAVSFPLYVIHFPVVRLVAFFGDGEGIRNEFTIATTCAAASVGLAAAWVMVSRHFIGGRRTGTHADAAPTPVGSVSTSDDGSALVKIAT